MTKGQKASRLIFLSMWAVLMTALTFVFGGPSLKMLRREMGRGGYWAVTVAISAFFAVGHAPFLAVTFFSLALLIGIFDEFEEMDFDFLTSTFLTVLVNTLLGAGAFALWVFHEGPHWSQILLAQMEVMLKPLAALDSHIQINYFDIMLQLPSIVLILWAASIYLAVLLERPRSKLRFELRSLRLPDPCVWILIAAVLGAFGDFNYHPLQAVCVNALNVCLVLFFFQGAAVVAQFFEKLRMGYFWQFLLMVLVVIHLFLLVSLVGLVDYWLDFRTRMAKKTEQVNREI